MGTCPSCKGPAPAPSSSIPAHVPEPPPPVPVRMQPPPIRVPEPVSPILRNPWRNISWGDKQTDLTYVMNYKPKDEVKHLRVLLYGPVGAGKSSFINSIASILRGRNAIPAAASAAKSEKSFTLEYKTHTVQTSDESCCPLVFNDIMGLEDGTDRGVRVEDIKQAMLGHIKEGYMFHPNSPLSERNPGYNPDPTLNDKSHVLVCVISANAAEIKASTLEKMKTVRELARDFEIPQMCIMTKVDEACEETEKNLQNVYKSKYIKKKMEDVRSAVGFPLNCIFPVKNYSEEIDLHDDVDVLMLSAVRRMIDFGNDAINRA